MATSAQRLELLAKAALAASDGKLTLDESIELLLLGIDALASNLDRGDRFLLKQASEIVAELAQRRKDGISLEDIKAGIVASYNPKLVERFYPED